MATVTQDPAEATENYVLPWLSWLEREAVNLKVGERLSLPPASNVSKGVCLARLLATGAGGI